MIERGDPTLRVHRPEEHEHPRDLLGIEREILRPHHRFTVTDHILPEPFLEELECCTGKLGVIECDRVPRIVFDTLPQRFRAVFQRHAIARMLFHSR